MESGKCSSGEARWFYNRQTHQCTPFFYSGCGGNGNNFLTKEHCEARCPGNDLYEFNKQVNLREF